MGNNGNQVSELKELLSTLMSQANLSSLEVIGDKIEQLTEPNLKPREQLDALEDIAILCNVQSQQYASYVSVVRFYIWKTELWRFETESVEGETRQKWQKWEDYIADFNDRMKSDVGLRKVYDDNDTLEKLENLGGVSVHDMQQMMEHPSKTRLAMELAHYTYDKKFKGWEGEGLRGRIETELGISPDESAVMSHEQVLADFAKFVSVEADEEAEKIVRRVRAEVRVDMTFELNRDGTNPRLVFTKRMPNSDAKPVRVTLKPVDRDGNIIPVDQIDPVILHKWNVWRTFGKKD